jgi:Flp pilus assembly protein CpaB
MTYRVRNIAVAVGLALIAALLTTFYVANYKRHVRQSESTVTVYVAKKDIPQGTLGSDLVKHGLIGPADVVQRSVVPGAISNPDQVRNLLTREEVYAGEQVSLRRFADHAEQGVRVQLHGQVRAVSIPGTPDALLVGTLRAGDHVDVVANLKDERVAGGYVTRDVVQDLIVLSTGTESAASKVTPQGATSVLLAVSDRKEAQKIWYAIENAAGWSLLLRPVAGATTPPIDMEVLDSMEADSASPREVLRKLGGAR